MYPSTLILQITIFGYASFIDLAIIQIVVMWMVTLSNSTPYTSNTEENEKRTNLTVTWCTFLYGGSPNSLKSMQLICHTETLKSPPQDVSPRRTLFVYTPIKYLHGVRLFSWHTALLRSTSYEILQIFKHIKGVVATKTDSITAAVSQQQYL